MKKIIWTQIIAITFTVSIIAGLVGGALTNEYLIAYLFGQLIERQEENFPIVKKVIEERIYVEESSTIAAIEKANPSVVQLENGKPGVILTTDGIVATCNSVVRDKNSWRLTLGVEVLDSTVVYRSPDDNVALLKINTEQDFKYFSTLTFVQGVLKPGQKVLSLGKDKVKSGIISQLPDLNSNILIDYEIDSSLSCGPSINLGGELIGLTLDDDSIEQGISYIIPAQKLQKILDSYQQYLQ